VKSLEEILQESSSRHRHLCPRQVLGARMALYASELLGIDLSQNDKRLLVIAETYGCTVDGLIAATGCRVGSRTLQILDFGKVAATFIDTDTGDSVRIVPSVHARALAGEFAPHARNHWKTMLQGYQIMPVDILFTVSYVQLNVPLEQVLSRPGKKTVCEMCGEEIINGREVINEKVILCRACAGESYYRLSFMPSLLQIDH